MKKSILLILILITMNVWPMIIIEGELTQEITVDPGQTYRNEIIVKNPGNRDEIVKVYLKDYSFMAGGQVYYDDPGTLERSNCEWITYNPKEFRVSANSSYTLTYFQTVPNKIMNGTYWCMMMVEAVTGTSEDTESPKQNKGQGLSLRQSVRYGIQIVSQIGKTGTRQIKFINAGIQKTEEGAPILYYDIENTGERWVVSDSYVELYGSTGDSYGQFESGRLRIYPGCSVRFSTKFTDIPPDLYQALVIVDCGDDDVFGARYNLNFTE